MIQNVSIENIWHRLDLTLGIGSVIVTYCITNYYMVLSNVFFGIDTPVQDTALPGDRMWTSP